MEPVGRWRSRLSDWPETRPVLDARRARAAIFVRCGHEALRALVPMLHLQLHVRIT